jgi:DNA mismatch repair protein MutS
LTIFRYSRCPRAPRRKPPSSEAQRLDAIKALHPDEMSPRKALEALYALKGKLPKDG